MRAQIANKKSLQSGNLAASLRAFIWTPPTCKSVALFCASACTSTTVPQQQLINENHQPCGQGHPRSCQIAFSHASRGRHTHKLFLHSAWRGSHHPCKDPSSWLSSWGPNGATQCKRLLVAVKLGPTHPLYPTRVPDYSFYSALQAHVQEKVGSACVCVRACSWNTPGRGDLVLRLEEFVLANNGRCVRMLLGQAEGPRMCAHGTTGQVACRLCSLTTEKVEALCHTLQLRKGKKGRKGLHSCTYLQGQLSRSEKVPVSKPVRAGGQKQNI
eukprot:375155-Pelagomonas_calceolata.AAC.3